MTNALGYGLLAGLGTSFIFCLVLTLKGEYPPYDFETRRGIRVISIVIALAVFLLAL